MTLITYGNSDGTRRCDARCYLATETPCSCICGGRNHGEGLDVAMDNTRRLGAAWAERWERDHPGDKVRILGTESLFPPSPAGQELQP